MLLPTDLSLWGGGLLLSSITPPLNRFWLMTLFWCVCVHVCMLYAFKHIWNFIVDFHNNVPGLLKFCVCCILLFERIVRIREQKDSQCGIKNYCIISKRYEPKAHAAWLQCLCVLQTLLGVNPILNTHSCADAVSVVSVSDIHQIYLFYIQYTNNLSICACTAKKRKHKCYNSVTVKSNSVWILRYVPCFGVDVQLTWFSFENNSEKSLCTAT